MIQILAGQTLIMFLMVLAGYVIFRTHLSDHDGNRTISNVLLMVVTPAMLLNAMLSIEYTPPSAVFCWERSRRTPGSGWSVF